jgi:hypothetical protein
MKYKTATLERITFNRSVSQSILFDPDQPG